MEEFHFKRKSPTHSISKSPAIDSGNCGSSTGSGDSQLESACEASDDPGDGNENQTPLKMDSAVPNSTQFDINAAPPLPPPYLAIWPPVLEKCMATREDMANSRSKSLNMLSSSNAIELAMFDTKLKRSDSGEQSTSMSVRREMGTTSSNSDSSSSHACKCNMNFLRCSDKSFQKDDLIAWFVCASAFLGGCVVWGTSGAFPLLLNSMIATFNVSAREHNQTEDSTIAFKLSFIQAVQFFLSMTGSLFAGPLCEVIGIRLITVLGVLLAFSGPFLPYFFRDSIVSWIIGIGLLNGLGNSMIEVARPLVVRQHFSKYYGLASGIVGSGSAVAFTLFPLAIDFALDFNKPPLNETTDPLKHRHQEHLANRLQVVLLGVSACYASLVVCIALWTDHSLAAGASNSAHSSQNTATTSANGVPKSRSLVVSEDIATNTTSMMPECDFCTHQQDCMCTRCRPARFALLPQDDLMVNSKRDKSDQSTLKHSWSDHIVASECAPEALDFRSRPLSETPPTPPSPTASMASKSSLRKWFRARNGHLLGFKWHLLRNYNFMVIAFAHSISYMASSIPDMHMYKYVEDTYPDCSSALTLSVYGLTTFFFSILSGKLSDMYPRVYMQMFIMAIGQWVTGISFTLCPLLFPRISSFAVPIALNAIWGFGDAGQSALYSVSIANTAGTRDLAQALGIVAALSGVMYTVGGPLGGLFYSIYGNYTVAFFMSGAMQQLAAIGFYLLDRKCSTSLGAGRAEADAAEEGITSESTDRREAGRRPP